MRPILQKIERAEDSLLDVSRCFTLQIAKLVNLLRGMDSFGAEFRTHSPQPPRSAQHLPVLSAAS